MGSQEGTGILGNMLVKTGDVREETLLTTFSLFIFLLVGDVDSLVFGLILSHCGLTGE